MANRIQVKNSKNERSPPNLGYSYPTEKWYQGVEIMQEEISGGLMV
jgi:hypothetical protein